MEALGKLTIASMQTRAKRAAADNIKTPLARIMGTATNLKAAVDTNGEPIFGLVGQFLGINIAEHAADPTKGEYTSGVCYLPGGLQEMIQQPLEQQLNDPDKSVATAASIEFAMDIFAVPASNKAGYSFIATLLGDASRADPFAAVKARIGDKKLPALPSPKEIEAANTKTA